MKKVIISVFAVFALVGCAKEMPHGQNGSNEVKVERGPLVQMQAIISDSDSQTRVSVDEQTGKLSWSEGDQVAVVLSEGTTYALDTKKYTINHETGILEIPNNSAYVIYPASQVTKLEGTKLTLTLPSTHEVATPADAFDNALMKGVVNASENRVEFKNLLGFFKVPLTGEGKLKSAVLRTICRTTSDFHPVSKSATLDLSKDATTADGAIKMAATNTAFAWVRYNFSGDVDLSSNPSVYFAVPAGEYANMGIVLVTDKGSNAIYAANAHEVNRSSVKPVSASAINLSAHTPANTVSLVGTSGDSQEDYANCYIVPPTAGSYEFDCKLADGTDLKGGVTAEIKWAEQAGMINDICYDSESNKISFKTNGKEGNALVVLTRNSEANIVWTWHIWITDTPKVLNINGGKSSTDDRTSNQYYLMDRVLGATWAPSSTLTADASKTYDGKDVPMCKTLSSSDATEACGVYFQYQNRIPLPRIKNIDATDQEAKETMNNTRCDVMYGFSQYGQYWTSSTNPGNIWQDTSTGQYIYNNLNYHNYEYSISGSDNNTIWMPNVLNGSSVDSQAAIVDGGYRFWSSNTSREHESMIASKTNYDPCPPGYVVETSSCQYSYVNLRSKDVSFARAAADNTTAYKEGYKFYGMYFNLAKDEQGNTLALYFSCASQRSGCVVTRLSGTYGNMGYIYAMNTGGDAGKTYSVTTDKAAAYGAAIQYGANTSGQTIGWPGWSGTKKVNAQAYNVRCRRGKF